VIYDVVGVLGRGGTGVVELAELPDGTRVARKRIALHGSARQAEVAVRRLRREAEVLANLRHPNIVRLLHVEEDGESVVLVVPWLEGGSLHDRVALGRPLPPDEVDALARALLPALAAAHAAGVVHRDLSPANICFDREGTPVLVDFGAATCRAFTAGLTYDGCVIGTPAFLAPELAQGRPAGPAADVFGLGACLWFALTGASPITGTSEAVEPAAAIAAAAAFGGAAAARRPLPAGTPLGLVRMLAALLEPDPRRRPAAAAALPLAATTLNRTLEAKPARRRPRRRRRGALAVAGSLALVAGGAGAGYAARPPATPAGLQGRSTGQTASDVCPTLPFRSGCNGPVAPNTDGHRCIGDHADYDGVATNGCEAAPDRFADGTRLAPGRPVAATLVPAADVDTFSLVVTDRFQWSCDGKVAVTLTAPSHAAYRLDVLDGSKLLGSADSVGGRPATVTLGEPRCLDDDATTLTARVRTAVAPPSADPYRLSWTGTW
jgi:tRNA A-37 threonylcarbamoyl transferase component Bud32